MTFKKHVQKIKQYINEQEAGKYRVIFSLFSKYSAMYGAGKKVCGLSSIMLFFSRTILL